MPALALHLDTPTMQPELSRAARPGLKDRDFFVTGESYAGHYIPVVTHHIWRTNKAKPEGERINLKGMAIGDGGCAVCSA